MITLKAELYQLKQDIAKRYGGVCFFCGARESKKGMTFHHIWYENNDVIHSNYPKNSSGNIQYHKDLLKKIKENPKRFRYLCNNHHQALEKFLRYGDDMINKLMKERKRTLKLRNKYNKV